MYCVYSPWGFHRCYQMKSDADADAKRANSPRKGLMHHTVLECSVEIKPDYSKPPKIT